MTYVKPQITIHEFGTADIVTTSMVTNPNSLTATLDYNAVTQNNATATFEYKE